MTLAVQRKFRTPRMVLAAAIVAACSAACVAQNSDSQQTSKSDLEFQANTHSTAAGIGLPEYPGASPYKNPNDKDSDSALDLGMSFGHVHFQIKAVSYTTPDSSAQILNFYRKPLSHYGQVLECDDGRPVGPLQVTRSGLTCNNDSLSSSGSKVDASDGHELRAGSPTLYRLVGIDKSHPGSTRFGIAYIEVPKVTRENNETK